MTSTSLEGHRALVTGGGTGVGRTVALKLAQAGAEVTVCGRRLAPLEETAAMADRVSYAITDVTDEAAITELFEKFGPFDIVIANAGGTQSAPLTRVNLADWQQTLNVNLTGVFLTFRAALAGLKGRPWGRLVAIASTAGLKGYGYVVPYCAAKHGVVGLTRALALETARGGVTVNALCPGFIDTPMTEESIQNIIDKTGKNADEATRALTSTNPMGRLIQTDEVAASVMYLCGEHSGSINGQAIAIAGGEV